MHQGNQKPVFVQRSIHCNLMFSIGHPAVISMPRDPFINNFKMYPIFSNEFKTGFNRSFRKVFLQCFVHCSKNRIFKMVMEPSKLTKKKQAIDYEAKVYCYLPVTTYRYRNDDRSVQSL